jgi:hypothetical protein
VDVVLNSFCAKLLSSYRQSLTVKILESPGWGRIRVACLVGEW